MKPEKLNGTRFIFFALLTFIILFSGSCTKKDIIAGSNFYIDLNTGSVTDQNGNYTTTISDFTKLYTTGGYVYILGTIVFKGLDQSYYALSQYHTADGCSVEYQVNYDELVCPCDQYHFDKYGHETVGSGTSYLTPYYTSLSNNILHVYAP